MPDIVISNAGQLLLLNWCLQSTSTPEDMVLKLFKNDYTPTVSSTTGSFTECDFSNYTSQSISRGTWGNAALVSGVATSTYGTTFTWTVGTTGNTVYGYYLVGATSGTLIGAQRFDSPKTYVSGDVVTITPTLTLIDQS